MHVIQQKLGACGAHDSTEAMQESAQEPQSGSGRYSLKITKKPVPATPRGVLAE
jgi:hypothetical protein